MGHCNPAPEFDLAAHAAGTDLRKPVIGMPVQVCEFGKVYAGQVVKLLGECVVAVYYIPGRGLHEFGGDWQPYSDIADSKSAYITPTS